MIVAQRPNRSNQTTVSEERKVTRKTFVIDTNVLVHDPSSIKKFKDNDVVISLAVLEELDGLKRHGDAYCGNLATKANHDGSGTPAEHGHHA